MSNDNIIIINTTNIDNITSNNTQNYIKKPSKYKKINIFKKPIVFKDLFQISKAPYSNNSFSFYKNNTDFSIPSSQTYKFLKNYCNFLENKFLESLKNTKKKTTYSYKFFKLYSKISKYCNKPPPPPC